MQISIVVFASLCLANCFSEAKNFHYNNKQHQYFDQEIADSFASSPLRPRRSHLAARRAADDSRPLSRYVPAAAASEQQDAAVVMGKFKAPAPERIHKQRISKSQDQASQTVSASFRVSDDSNDNNNNFATSSSSNEKIIHGINNNNAPQFGRPRKVSAKIMVSDEGLNYPPSKLSADIHGNVAEIVTAPPEAVESDLFLPPASKLFGR